MRWTGVQSPISHSTVSHHPPYSVIFLSKLFCLPLPCLPPLISQLPFSCPPPHLWSQCEGRMDSNGRQLLDPVYTSTLFDLRCVFELYILMIVFHISSQYVIPAFVTLRVRTIRVLKKGFRVRYFGLARILQYEQNHTRNHLVKTKSQYQFSLQIYVDFKVFKVEN